MEAHEPTLASRRLELALNYVLNLNSLPENPAYSCLFEPENVKLFEEPTSKIPPLGIRILPHLQKSKISLNLTDDVSSLDIAPWTLSAPTDRFDLTRLKKDTTIPEIYKQFCLQHITKYPSSHFIFFIQKIQNKNKKSMTVQKQRKESCGGCLHKTYS